MPEDLTELEQEEIASQILKGCTSGLVDYEDENNNTIRVSWELKTNKFLR